MQLNGGESFTKIDLSNAYNQISLDDESSRILTWSTHKGLYKVNRLPYGITPASAIFEKNIEQLLQGCKGTANFLDDIIITGKTRTEHEENLKTVFLKLREAGLQLKKEKCEFFKEEISYLGYTISNKGLKKNLDKQKAIINAPRPRNISQVKSFEGMINYYGKFVPKLSIIMKPIYDLLQKNSKFNWNEKCEKAFKEIKEIIISDDILMHFNPQLPIILQTDASQEGIAGALCHKLENGSLKPVGFVSRTLMQAEKNYSVLDKEALAIYWSVKKFYQYLMGNEFVIQTDHKPLTHIFGDKKGIPQMAASRLQRWAVFLSGFSYKVEYVKGKDNNVADMLSRHPTKIHYISEDHDIQSSYLNFVIKETPIDHKQIAVETRKDPVLARVLEYIMTGWPDTTEDSLQTFFDKRFELTCEQGCVMWGYRVVIPKKFRSQLLLELHSSHLGIVKMKSIARAYFYWPGLNAEIETLGKQCIPCVTNTNDPRKSMTIPWSRPQRPWERIHIDFAGPVNNCYYFIIIDAYSKYPEIFKMSNITTDETISKLRETFSRWGIPNEIISDNGPQLTSQEFKKFITSNGIKHITSAPYHPATNGAAENAVKTFKKSLKAALNDTMNRNVPTEVIICRYLMNYRNSVHCATNEMPSVLMIGRKVKTLFDLLKPSKENTKVINHKGRVENFMKGQNVMIKDYRDKNNPRWIKAKIHEILGNKNYLCKTIEDKICRRHLDQIKKFEGDSSHEVVREPMMHKTPSNTISTAQPTTHRTAGINPSPFPSNSHNNSNSVRLENSKSRTGRQLCKPSRFKDYDCN